MAGRGRGEEGGGGYGRGGGPSEDRGSRTYGLRFRQWAWLQETGVASADPTSWNYTACPAGRGPVSRRLQGGVAGRGSQEGRWRRWGGGCLMLGGWASWGSAQPVAG